MQNVAAAEAREVIGRIAKPKLMNGAVSTEELELSMLEIGIHLQDGNSVVRILKRAHSEVTPSFQLENYRGGPRDVFFIPQFINTVNIISRRIHGRLSASHEFLPLRLKVKNPTLSRQKAAGQGWGTLFDDPKQKGRRLCSRRPCFS
jgi:hypothetical protein